MRSISGHASHAVMLALATAVVLAAPRAAFAQSSQVFNNSVSTNLGASLPPVPMPNGHDEIRSSDGTTCRSNIANSGAYLDFGMLGSQKRQSDESVGLYARVVVPLNARPPRIDCSEVYQLEVERLTPPLDRTRRQRRLADRLAA